MRCTKKINILHGWEDDKGWKACVTSGDEFEVLNYHKDNCSPDYLRWIIYKLLENQVLIIK